MDVFVFLPVAVVATALVAWFWRSNRHVRTVYQNQKGVLYQDGKLQRILDPGRHGGWKERTRIDVYDLRPQVIMLGGQEILTLDKIGVRISLAGHFRIETLETMIAAATDAQADLYMRAQLALRQIVGAVSLDDVLSDQGDIDKKLMDSLAPQAAALGLKLEDLTLRDVMIPAGLKRAYAGVLEAQKLAQKELEKARGEQAVLRSLANSSKLYESNPLLLQARLVQALGEGKHTIVFGAEGAIVPKLES